MDQKIGFIGGGHITEMLLSRLVSSGVVAPDRISVSDIDKARLGWLRDRFGVNPALDNRETFAISELTLVCVQPQVVPLVVEDLKGVAIEGKALLTIAAGIPMKTYEAIGPGLAVFRALPNPPSKVGAGIIPFSTNGSVTEKQKNLVNEILSVLGKCIPMNEDGISVVTALSSPAPVFHFMESMVEAGVLCGLSRQDAVTVTYQTLSGCLRLWESSEKKSFSDLIADASTPAGISVESLYVMDRHAFRGAVKEAYLEGARKARRLSGEGN